MTATITPPETPAAPVEDEEGLALGRPIEDRSFEAVEAGAGLMTGLIVGTAVAGPVGTAIGGAVGVVAGLAAGEALERHEGRAARTTDAS